MVLLFSVKTSNVISHKKMPPYSFEWGDFTYSIPKPDLS